MGEQGSLLDADRGPGSLPIDTTPTIQLLPKKTPGPPAGQARPRKTFLVHPWPPARHQAAPRMPPAPKALEMSDKLIDAQMSARITRHSSMPSRATHHTRSWISVADPAAISVIFDPWDMKPWGLTDLGNSSPWRARIRAARSCIRIC